MTTILTLRQICPDLRRWQEQPGIHIEGIAWVLESLTLATGSTGLTA